MKYKSKDFQVGYLPYYRLLVSTQHGVDQICVVDDEHSIIAYDAYESANPTNEVLNLLSLPFTKVHISVPHHCASIFPQEVYSAADPDAFTDYLELKLNTPVCVKEVDAFRVNVLYQLDAVLYHRWNKIYPEAVFAPRFSVLFDQAAENRHTQGTVAYIQFGQDGTMVLLVANGEELVFFNSFSVLTKEDLIYYLLLVRKQLGLNDVFHKAYMSGKSLEASWIAALRPFCAGLETPVVASGLQVPERLVIEDIDSINHLFHNSACELLAAR